MFLSLYFFILAVFSVAVSGEILKPENLTLMWLTDFNLNLSWTSPKDLGPNCEYKVALKRKEETEPRVYNTDKLYYSGYAVMEGGSLQISVCTMCGNVYSDWVYNNITAPDLVQNVQCVIHSSSRTHCSWTPQPRVQNLTFFYKLTDEDGTSDGDKSYQIEQCSNYTYTDGKRTGCDLRMKPSHAIHMVFNGTFAHRLVRNTFRRDSLPVTPPPLNWTVVEAGDKFNISWIPPDVFRLESWKFTINYTVCDEPKVKPVDGATWTELDRLPQCQYSMNIKAKTRIGKGETLLSDTKSFDKLTDPNALVIAAIIIPLVFASLAVLTFVFFRKNKEIIFPKVPKPVDLINNNNIDGLGVYVPAAEEDCKITLVIDP